MRAEPKDTSELVSQVIYGESFKIIEQRTNWSLIKLSFDNYNGWIDNKQLVEISKTVYDLTISEANIYSSDLIEFIQINNKGLLTIPFGSTLNSIKLFDHSFDGNTTKTVQPKENLVKTSLLFINSPYLWGGRTPFGIDCSGFTQMIYKINGYKIDRDAKDQVKTGASLSFIEESEPGDLAFFDNKEGDIVHVGIIMEDNHIIHAHGQVRIDRLDQTGIYNVDTKKHTHKLRVIKKII
jgi:hypothetical protein|tara:strand:- start:1329 stop:2042 length:714 start_codon:yes stop_codon:yes gene_type:complete